MDIDYAIIRRKRKTLSIVIRPNNDIEVLAPNRMPASLIHHFVQDKNDWIQKKLQFNKETRAAYQPKLFVEGECFDVLGKAYPLTIKNPIANKQKGVIHIADDKLIMPFYPIDKAKKQLTAWYRQTAEQYFRQRSAHFAPIVGKTPAHIAVKAYKSRWGSCHHDGRIYFNWRLIMAPDWVVDYVVVHELCHLIHHNHSKLFWQQVTRIMPDYRHAQTWLKTNGMLLQF